MAKKPSAADLAERTIHRRAIEAITWGIGAVNFDLMFQAMVNAKGAVNQILYWSKPSDWIKATRSLTPDRPFMMYYAQSAIWFREAAARNAVV